MTITLQFIIARIGQRTDKVSCWHSSEKKQWWVATALLDIEPQLRRIKGYRALALLRGVLHAEAPGKELGAGHQAS